MAIDRFAPCPCGSGKKVKFCCGADLLAELEKIQRMLDGDQRQACLEYIEQLEQKHPGKPCLETVKTLLLASLGRHDEARATVDALLARDPSNPVALSELALLESDSDDPRSGIEPMQRALENCGDWIPGRVVQGVGHLGLSLLAGGDVLAARGHLLLAMAMNQEDETSMRALAELYGSPQVPLLLKDQPSLGVCPDDAPYRQALQEAMAPAHRGQWRVSVAHLEQLAGQYPAADVIWRNLATLQAWLGDWTAVAASLRTYAQLDVPLDDAVAAEAIAQLLDAPAAQDIVEQVHVIWELSDAEACQARLSADQRAVPLEAPPAIQGDDQPPPRAAWYLLDRAMPESAEGLQRTDVPHIVADLLLFGRQTDREARIEGQAYLHDVQRVDDALRSICGDALGVAGEPTTLREVPRSTTVLSWRWQLPSDISPDRMQELLAEQQRCTLLEVWPETPAAVLDGKTPRQAVADAQQRRAVLATLLRLELSLDELPASATIDELRTSLNLPLPQRVDAATVDPNTFPLARLHRVEFAQASDDVLVTMQMRALSMSARMAGWRTTQALLERPTLPQDVTRAELYGTLAALTENSAEAIGLLQQAQQAARDSGQSCGPWDVELVSLRLQRGEAEPFQELLRHIEQMHGREQNVMAGLLTLLQRAGLVDRQGRARVPVGAAAASDGSGLVLPGEPANEGIWTPEGEAAGKQKPGLWMPGMD